VAEYRQGGDQDADERFFRKVLPARADGPMFSMRKKMMPDSEDHCARADGRIFF